MHADDVSVVREISLFSGMSNEHFDEVLENAYLQHFPPHVQLIEEGGPADFLYVVVEGTVELFSNLNDRETTMLVLRPVSTFILAAVLKSPLA